MDSGAGAPGGPHAPSQACACPQMTANAGLPLTRSLAVMSRALMAGRNCLCTSWARPAMWVTSMQIRRRLDWSGSTWTGTIIVGTNIVSTEAGLLAPPESAPRLGCWRQQGVRLGLEGGPALGSRHHAQPGGKGWPAGRVRGGICRRGVAAPPMRCSGAALLGSGAAGRGWVCLPVS